MTEKDFASKLADGMRRARQSPPAPTLTRTPVVAASPSRVTSRTRLARQADQSPPTNLDRPWADLHPERVWPD